MQGPIWLESTEVTEIPGVRFYCTGFDQGREGDADYMAAFDLEVEEMRAALVAAGTVAPVGIGGAGADFVWILSALGGLKALLELPDATRKFAQAIREFAARARSARHSTWRLSREAIVLECCTQLRERLGDGIQLAVDHIVVTTVERFELELAAIPAAAFVVLVPEITFRRTHVFRANTELEVVLVAELEGVPSSLNSTWGEG